MRLIELHPHDLRPLPFYLALEQWCAMRWAGEETVFTWRVLPTVICGRHQCIEAEVDLGYCQEHGIDVVRRRSGGGCVYADPDNLMISCVAPTHGKPVAEVFSSFASRVASLLQSLGVKAEVQGRNDIAIEGRKVSGCAYYQPSPTMAIAHGTMLFKADAATMSRAITPQRAKLVSKGVPSVAARITTLSEHAPGLTIEAFRQALRDSDDCELVTLTDQEIAEVESIEAAYRDPVWMADRRLPLADDIISRTGRVDGAGLVHIDARLKDGTIEEARISGDFFCPQGGSVADIEGQLKGQRPGSVSICDASAISGLDTKQLEEIINSTP